MEKKTVYEIEKEAFDNTFHMFRTNRIVLYGIGRMTATLLPLLSNYNIVGLLDRDKANIGKKMYGYPIISLEEAEKSADLIIINTAESYWSLIYKRIQEVKIPVYYRNGDKAQLKIENRDYSNLEYWNIGYDELKSRIADYDIVSFDVFDTLIMRKVCSPYDIFTLVDFETKQLFGENLSFLPLRKQASSEAGETATISELYQHIGTSSALSTEQIEMLKNSELMIEHRYFCKRSSMVSLLQHVCAEKKDIYLISDMYLEKEYIQELIKEFAGVEIPLSHILVSSDRKKSKKDGTLWEEFRNNIENHKKVIHIGDNLQADEIMPGKHKIDSYRIFSADEMMKNSSMAGLPLEAEGIYESVMLGHVLSHIYNDPFSLNVTKGKVRIRTLRELGYNIIGPVIYVFLQWLMEQAEEKGITDLLFMARDGYFLEQDYQYLLDLRKGKSMANGHYFAASRRIVTVASIENRNDFRTVLGLPYNGKIGQLMEDRFNIDLDKNDSCYHEDITLPADLEKAEAVCMNYQEQLKEEIIRETKNYRSYIEKFNITDGFAIADFCFYGTTQYYLQKIINKKLNGFYFFADVSEDNHYFKDNMFPCFQKSDDKKASGSKIKKHAMILESFLTAPYGMIKCIDDNGNYQCSPGGKNQIFFKERELVNEGVKEFIKDMVESKIYEFMKINDEIIDFTSRLYGSFMVQDDILEEEIKNIFYFDNAMIHRSEQKIFE